VEAVNGVVDTVIADWLVTLFGPQSMIGKSIVVSISLFVIIHYYSHTFRHSQPAVQ